MPSKAEQIIRTRRAQQKAENWFSIQLRKWYRGINDNWEIGDTLSREQIEELRRILEQGYAQASNTILGVNWRTYLKQNETWLRVMEDIAATLDDLFSGRVRSVTPSVIDHTVTLMRRATADANTAVATNPELIGSEQRIASGSLNNRTNNHRLTIAVTEGEWAIQTARNTAVLTVADPLNNSVEEIISLIDAGDINGARRLSREVNRLARLPLSVSQGNVVQFISESQERLVTPGAQAGVIQRLRKLAEETDNQLKEWMTIGDSKVRDTHVAVNGVKRPIDIPFQLEGGLMQYPTDGSLGASLSEIINCRCIAVYL